MIHPEYPFNPPIQTPGGESIMNQKPLRSFCPHLESLEGREVPTALSLPFLTHPAVRPVVAAASNQPSTPRRVPVTPAPPHTPGTIAPINPYTRSIATKVTLLTPSLFPVSGQAPKTATVSGNYDPGLYYAPLSVTGLPRQGLNLPASIPHLNTTPIVTPTPPLQVGGFTFDASGVLHGTSLF
jgi:hypothetical protein